MPAVNLTVGCVGRLVRRILLIPSWEGPVPIPKKRGPCEVHSILPPTVLSSRSLPRTRPDREGLELANSCSHGGCVWRTRRVWSRAVTRLPIRGVSSVKLLAPRHRSLTSKSTVFRHAEVDAHAGDRRASAAQLRRPSSNSSTDFRMASFIARLKIDVKSEKAQELGGVLHARPAHSLARALVQDELQRAGEPTVRARRRRPHRRPVRRADRQ